MQRCHCATCPRAVIMQEGYVEKLFLPLPPLALRALSDRTSHVTLSSSLPIK